MIESGIYMLVNKTNGEKIYWTKQRPQEKKEYTLLVTSEK